MFSDVWMFFILRYFFRLFADILNDIAIFLEILAPSFQSMFTVIVCTAGVFKVSFYNMDIWWR